MGTSCIPQIVLLLLVTSLDCSQAELPFGISPCARNATNLNTCVLKMVQHSMDYVLGGHSKLFGKFDTFPLKNLTLNVNGDGIQLHVIGKEVLWHGLDAAAINNFKFDLDKMKMSFDLSIPSMTVGGTCDVKGHIHNEGVYADGKRFPYATILNSITDEFSAIFNFSLEMKTNASGTFLIPVLTSYNPHLNVGTVTLENIFPVGYVPDRAKVDLLKKAEDTTAKIFRDLFANLIGQMVPATASVILQFDTYDQFFPWTVSVGSVPALTGGWLMVILIIGISTLLKSI